MKGFTVSEALARLASEKTDYMRLIEDADYDIGLYKPDGVDPQTLHNRDEVYVVATGTGEFVCDGKTQTFAPGDMLMVSAGVVHRFENFSDDFSTWVVFFGARR